MRLKVAGWAWRGLWLELSAGQGGGEHVPGRPGVRTRGLEEAVVPAGTSALGDRGGL